MSALHDRKERLNKFLKWANVQEDLTYWEVKEWLFSSYALSEKAIGETLKQLKYYGYITYKGNKIKVGKRKQLL
jgi:hypothetical protein